MSEPMEEERKAGSTEVAPIVFTPSDDTDTVWPAKGAMADAALDGAAFAIMAADALLFTAGAGEWAVVGGLSSGR